MSTYLRSNTLALKHHFRLLSIFCCLALTLSITSIAQAQASGYYGQLFPGQLQGQTIAAATSGSLNYHSYHIEVPAGSQQLLIRLTDHGQDLDIAAKAGSEILDYETDVDAIDVSETANPVLTINQPQAGLWYIDVINFYQSSANYQLLIEIVSSSASIGYDSGGQSSMTAIFETVSSAMQDVAASNTMLNERLVTIVNAAGMVQQDYQLAYDESIVAQQEAEALYEFFTELRSLAETGYQNSPAQSDDSNIAIFLINLAVEGQNAMAAWYDWLNQLQQSLQAGTNTNLVLDVPLSTAIFHAERYEAWYKVFTGESSLAELEQFLSNHQQAPSYLESAQSALAGSAYSGYDDALMFGLQNQMMNSMHDTSMNIIAAIGGGCYDVDRNNDGYCD